VYGIVVQSAGYIWVESEPDKGSTFKICLPRVELEDERADLPAETQGLPRGSETILIVEDEDAVRNVAARVLGNQGYTVAQAANGEEALQLVEELEGKIDLVLTDVVMPDMGGIELTDRLRQWWPELGVLYMSGYAPGDKLKAELSDSQHPLLEKPFSAESLTLKVRQALDSKEDLKE
jgi:CheY-like chemotaxis protein